MSSSNTKRLFQAVDALNQQDSDKRTCRRPASSKRNAAAAQSQVSVYQSLVESRILLQRCRNEDTDQQRASTALYDQILSNLLMVRDRLNRNDGSSQDLLDFLGQLEQPLNGQQNGSDDEKYHASNEKISDYLQDSFNKERLAWKEVLDRRHKDVRLHAGAVTSKQFRSLDSSFFDQVEASIEHEKTRFDYNQDNVDDSRLYQHILKDFVGSQSKTNTGTLLLRGAVSTKSKGHVDRKASKGRKIRYTEIPKLVHFTFPLSRPDTDLETNAWFRSLFGGAVTAAKSSTK